MFKIYLKVFTVYKANFTYIHTIFYIFSGGINYTNNLFILGKIYDCPAILISKNITLRNVKIKLVEYNHN